MPHATFLDVVRTDGHVTPSCWSAHAGVPRLRILHTSQPPCTEIRTKPANSPHLALIFFPFGNSLIDAQWKHSNASPQSNQSENSASGETVSRSRPSTKHGPFPMSRSRVRRGRTGRSRYHAPVAPLLGLELRRWGCRELTRTMMHDWHQEEGRGFLLSHSSAVVFFSSCLLDANIVDAITCPN